MIKRSFLRILLSLGVVTLLGPLTWGPRADAQETENESRFVVELVVFRHLDQSRTTPEMTTNDAIVLPATEGAVSYAAASSEQRQLDRIGSQIRNLRAYQFVRQLAWAQSADDMQGASYANLSAMGLDPAQVTGTARLYTRRYLHLELQLALPATGATISGSRRIRLNQVHYFDNPEFGVLALVTRAE